MRAIVVCLTVCGFVASVCGQKGTDGKARADGLVVTSPQSEGLATAPFAAMEKAIRDGEFKKIGSVLVARHGKLVYEGYFDGDGSTLRDTRSATKSITDILVGIAIGEKRLSGVEARVLALLPVAI